MLICPKIVEKSSATLGLPDSRETVIALDADHETICRFAHEDDENYKHVSALIVDLATSAVQARSEPSRKRSFSNSGPALVESSPTAEMPKEGFCMLAKMGYGKSLSDVVIVPYSRNGAFVDRSPIAQQMKDRIIPIGKVHARVALFGLGGVGSVYFPLLRSSN